jgi:hypothetical protein
VKRLHHAPFFSAYTATYCYHKEVFICHVQSEYSCFSDCLDIRQLKPAVASLQAHSKEETKVTRSGWANWRQSGRKYLIKWRQNCLCALAFVNESNINNIHIKNISSYLTENILHLHYKHQQVTDVYFQNRLKHTYIRWDKAEFFFLTLKHVAHIVTALFEWVKYNRRKHMED